MSLNQRRHWFAQADARGLVGNAPIRAGARPYLIRPNKHVAERLRARYRDPSPCSENGDRDWYVEGRALAGKDVIAIGGRTRRTPASFVLSNGTTGINGFRTDDYLFVPLGMTARTTVASQNALSVNLEFDPLIHGWQKTRDSALGGGDIPATRARPRSRSTASATCRFRSTGDGRLAPSAKYQVTRRWSVEPYYVHWRVSASPVSYEDRHVHRQHITAREQFGAYEPLKRHPRTRREARGSFLIKPLLTLRDDEPQRHRVTGFR